MFQGMLEKIMTIEQLADATYSNKEVLDFELILDNKLILHKPTKLSSMLSNKV